MCREECSIKCFFDNFLLVFYILIFMSIYMLILTNNPGVIAITIILSGTTFILTLIRIEEYGLPSCIKYCITQCKDGCKEEEERPVLDLGIN